MFEKKNDHLANGKKNWIGSLTTVVGKDRGVARREVKSPGVRIANEYRRPSSSAVEVEPFFAGRMPV